MKMQEKHKGPFTHQQSLHKTELLLQFGLIFTQKWCAVDLKTQTVETGFPECF